MRQQLQLQLLGKLGYNHLNTLPPSAKKPAQAASEQQLSSPTTNPWLD